MTYKAIKYIMLYFAALLVCGVAMTACQSEDELLKEVESDAKVIIVVPDKILENANSITRSSLAFDTNSTMKFSWQEEDKIGVFNVSLPATLTRSSRGVGDEDESSAGQDQGESVQTSKAENVQFKFKPGSIQEREDGSFALFNNDNYSFSKENYWVAYSPYLCVPYANGRTKVTEYNSIPLTYKGQRQYTNAVPNGKHPNQSYKDHDPEYTLESEKKASIYLGEFDYMISNATQPDDKGFTTFTFSHVGSTIRLFLQFPAGAFGGSGKSAKVTSMSVISKGFHLVSDVELEILPYSADNTSTYREKESSKTLTNKLDLTCTGEGGTGISVPDNGYLISYMEFYPSEIPDKDCLLYVTAIVDGVEKHFRSKPLPAKTIVAGKLYQWKPTEWDDPIELTATLATWQEILAEEINVNLEN